MSALNICYIARLDERSTPGVAKKIKQTVSGLQELGHDCRASITPYREKTEFIFKSYRNILFSSANHIIYRSDILTPLITPAIIIKRILGGKVFIEVPTPYSTYIHEIKLAKKSKPILRAMTTTYIRLFFPLSWLPANKILQYAPDSKYFSFGLKNKTTIVTNGFRVASVRPQHQPPWPDPIFRIIAVGALSDWHGFDRVIQGIAEYAQNNKSSNTNAHLTIVGDGPAKIRLMALAESLNIERLITFTGTKTGEDLDALFDNAHIAIGSLGLHRIGLRMASVLKLREYASRGIPFVFSGTDLDFAPPPDFTLKVVGDDTGLNISDLLDWYSNLRAKEMHPEKIRDYALEKVDFNSKLTNFI